MPRLLILAIVVVAVVTVYAVIDCAMTDARRSKVLPKPVWLVAILLLPVVGPVLWLVMGKHSRKRGTAPGAKNARSLENGTDESRSSMHDARIHDLEEQMRQLDEEIEADRRAQMRNHPSSGAHPIIPPAAPADEDEDADDDETGSGKERSA